MSKLHLSCFSETMKNCKLDFITLQLVCSYNMFSPFEDVFIGSFRCLHDSPCAVIRHVFTVNGTAVSITCCQSVSSLKSESFCGSEPTVPPTVCIYTSHNQQTPHANAPFVCLHTICSLTQTHTELLIPSFSTLSTPLSEI